MAAFADGHAGSLNKTSSAGVTAPTTYSQAGAILTAGVVENKDAAGTNGIDNIYDIANDASAVTYTAGSGSTSRAWVR